MAAVSVVAAGEIGVPDVIGTGEQVLAGPLQDDAPDAQHVRVGADAERQGRELLDQEHRDPASRGGLDEGDHAFHDDRGEPLGHLVDEEHPRLADDGAGQNEHLLFAAGQHLSSDLLTRLQLGEQLVGTGGIPRAAGGDGQVLLDGQPGEHGASLLDVGQAARGTAVAGQALNLLAVERDGAVLDGDHACDSVHERRLARAVGAEQDGDLSLRAGQAHVADDRQFATLDRDARR